MLRSIKVVTIIELTKRQELIVQIVKDNGPITGELIAEKLNLARATLRPDLAILTMAGMLDARPRVGYFYNGKSTNTIIAEKLNKITIGNIMSVPIVVTDESTVYDAVVTMFIEDVGSLFVVKEGGILEGVISRKDLLKIAMGGIDVQKMPVGVIMTRMPNIVTTTTDESIVNAAEKMILREVDGLPVIKKEINEKGEEKAIIVGRLTKTNITRVFVELGKDR